MRPSICNHALTRGDLLDSRFSHFIPCGVWEAIYILDGLTRNQSDIQPDTVHGDTQAQSAPVYGLAFLLGIKLMPRIRNWKDLKWFRPTASEVYRNIDGLFTKDAVDWDLIACHLPDMLQVAQSIQAGRNRRHATDAGIARCAQSLSDPSHQSFRHVRATGAETGAGRLRRNVWDRTTKLMRSKFAIMP